MKTFTGIIASMSLLVLAPPVAADTPVAANPNADLGVTASCQAGAPNFPEAPLGDCMAIRSNFERGNLTGAIPQVCNFAAAVEPDLFYYFYDSEADCVQDGASVFIG